MISIKRKIISFLITGAALIVLFLVAVNTGSLKASPEQILRGLFVAYDETVATIYSLRFPRILIAMLAGASVAVSGVMLQAVMKNPLADPGIMGISSGAGMAAVLVTAFAPSLYLAVPVFAFLGGVFACGLVYLLSWKGDLSPLRVILTGVAVNAFFTGLMSAGESMMGANYSGAASIVNGNITMKTWEDFRMLFIYAVIGLVLAVFLASKCDILGLEDQTIRSLGIRVNAVRLIVSAAAVLLASISTAVVGSISFLGLLVPHIARLLVGNSHKVLIPYTMLLGAFTLLLADTIGRTIAYPYEINAAVVMAVIGGPSFILLLRTMNEQKLIYEVQNLSFSYGEHQVLQEMSFSLQKGKITTLIGANGCGKSTLFQLLTRNLKPDQGEICLYGENLRNMKLKDLAKKAAIVHQYHTAPADLSVEKLIGYGRIPHRRTGSFKMSEKDVERVEWAMEVTRTEKYRNRPVSKLSGGQRQRVWIAMALAQDTELLLLDEPTTYLDVRYQIQILQLVRRLNEEYGLTIVMVLHDINQALYYSDEILAMKEGKMIGQGVPEEILTEELLEEIYGVRLPVFTVEKKPFILAV